MTGSVETFRRGATAYRNARDWAKEQRDEAIRRANEAADRSQAEALTADASLERSAFPSEGARREGSRLSGESRSLSHSS